MKRFLIISVCSLLTFLLSFIVVYRIEKGQLHRKHLFDRLIILDLVSMYNQKIPSEYANSVGFDKRIATQYIREILDEIESIGVEQISSIGDKDGSKRIFLQSYEHAKQAVSSRDTRHR